MTPPDDTTASPDRRAFLKAAGALAAGAATGAAAGCEAPAAGGASPSGAAPGFDRATLDALGEVVLPAELGPDGRRRAVADFVAWVDGYDPVAEEMHGYGYAEVRYLPPDPAPGWRAQLEGLDLLARRARRRAFAELPAAERRALVETALRGERGDRIPAPLAARHVALALLAHWAASPAAWDLACGARVGRGTCRPLAESPRKPLPLAPRA